MLKYLRNYIQNNVSLYPMQLATLVSICMEECYQQILFNTDFGVGPTDLAIYLVRLRWNRIICSGKKNMTSCSVLIAPLIF